LNLFIIVMFILSSMLNKKNRRDMGLVDP
jgi:hypothetical protein